MFSAPHFPGGWKPPLSHLSKALKFPVHKQATTYCTRPEHVMRPTPLRLMPLGGSITHGVGSSHQNGYRDVLLQLLYRHSYQVRLVGSRKSGTMTNNEHEGWRGFRIDQIATKAKASAEGLQPQLFTVNAGSNDCLQGYKLEEASRRMDNLLESLWLASPDSTVVIGSLLVNKDKRVDGVIRDFNQQLEKLVRTKRWEGRKVVFVDMHGGDGPLVEDLGEDGTHPNDAGYAKMAKIWLQGIQVASNSGFLSATETQHPSS